MASQSSVDDILDLDDFWESEDLGLGQGSQRADARLEPFESPSRPRLPNVIQWKLTYNGRSKVKNTEQEVVLAPSDYWEAVLQEKVQETTKKKLPPTAPADPDDTAIVVSIRSKRDVPKAFDGLDIGWPAIEQQMLEWAPLVHAGKELRLEISFNFSQSDASENTKSRKRGKKRNSATQRMLDERDAVLVAEETTTGEASIWQRVHSATRCAGPPCPNGDKYCWRDPVDGAHYRLMSHHFREIISFVNKWGTFEGHDDMPERIREQLYAEQQHRSKRQRQRSRPPPSEGAANIDRQQHHRKPPLLGILGLRDGAVSNYCDWHCSHVGRETLKKEFQKARDVVLDNGLDLEQVAGENPAFFIENGVKVGIARRFVWDVKTWVEEAAADDQGTR